ncbi:DUF4224 domain-containing protein [Microbulbifer sp. TYP-18]|uniref:DUF4224 domain-containing protein n=1 Tax=Microbulbifer sp. TYP-18 TaxID=3230024 RepID=UPI0034C6B301
MSEILTDAQLSRLTGVTSPDLQKLVLEENRIPYVRRKNGSPVVTWVMVNESQLIRLNKTRMAVASNDMPEGINMAAIDE